MKFWCQKWQFGGYLVSNLGDETGKNGKEPKFKVYEIVVPSVISSSTSETMVGGGFFTSDNPIFVFTSADKGLRSKSSSLAPRTLVSNSTV